MCIRDSTIIISTGNRLPTNATGNAIYQAMFRLNMARGIASLSSPMGIIAANSMTMMSDGFISNYNLTHK